MRALFVVGDSKQNCMTHIAILISRSAIRDAVDIVHHAGMVWMLFSFLSIPPLLSLGTQ